MAYEKTVWINGQAPALDADHLNKMEQGIADAVSVTPQNLTDDQKSQARGNINAAPGGFGLGGGAKELSAADDLNNIRVTGWYNWSYNSHPQNAPDNNWRQYGCAMHVFATAPGGYAIQTVYDLSDDITHGCAIQRTIVVTSSGDIYYPWEWVNPPMQLGVEYRTTERYFSKPVYCKVVDFGTAPNNDTKNVSLSGMNIDKVCGAIFHYYVITSDENGVMTSHPNFTGFLVSNDVIQIRTNTDKTDTKFYVTIKYTKTTD